MKTVMCDIRDHEVLIDELHDFECECIIVNLECNGCHSVRETYIEKDYYLRESNVIHREYICEECCMRNFDESRYSDELPF
jgi:hypothetical protein